MVTFCESHFCESTQFHKKLNHLELIHLSTTKYEILIYCTSQVDGSLGLKTRINEEGQKHVRERGLFTSPLFISIPCVLRFLGSMVVPWSSDDQPKNAVKFISVINIDD